ncbi:MAG: glycoside hydrolase family 127 protein [Sedimentisphaerales bacterium]|nr:glycoside hydrolase family 127 protein [Sedimentisphaerales bacterium]
MVPFQQVKMDDVIWAPRIKMLVGETLPHAFTQTEVAQRRLRMCAEYLENKGGPKPEAHRFNTSDLYKVMEGAALMIAAEPNPEIGATMDRIIDIIARAQQADGYLYVSHICGNPIVEEMGPRPYSYVLHSHELYNVGHLYEAAVAYAQATGKTKLLDVAEKSARHINKAFFEGDPNYNDGKPVNQAPGHEEIELGLMKLYNYTGKRLYLDMAKRFLDIRGVTYIPDGTGVNSPTYAQQHAPVAKQTEAVGHAVRATYLYAAMAEADSLLGSTDYSFALDSIWHNIVDTKMHITGGLGAVHGIEGFGPSYELPNKDTYLETCAAVGNVFFNMRMFLKYHDGKYADVAEAALLNNCLSGVGLDGKSFFYPNPLEADYGHGPRSGWFGTACCPSNIARLIPQIPGYMYATDGKQLYTVLYGSSRTAVELNGMKVALRQTTDYPYSGEIGLQVDPQQAVRFKLNLRIPTWAGSQLVPGRLYAYSEPSSGWTVEVNGQGIRPEVEKGFAVIERVWNPGDRISLKLPMPLKANTCIEQVAANRGRVSFSRGPLVYCAEGIDNGGAVQRFYVDPTKAKTGAKTQTIDSGVLAGLTEVTIPAKELSGPDRTFKDATLKLIPYFAWSNRDRSSMITWIGTKEELAKPDPRDPANIKYASVTASHTCDSDTVDAIRMDQTPKSSSDGSIQRWTSWPQTGQSQWVEIGLGEVKQIRNVGVYWYNDNGGVQLPGEWYLQAPSDSGWKKIEIYNTDQYSTLVDNYNTVHPAQSLKTDKIRIVMKPRHNDTCVGILAVNIETK